MYFVCVCVSIYDPDSIYNFSLLQALQFGFLDFSNFSVDEYEHFEVSI